MIKDWYHSQYVNMLSKARKAQEEGNIDLSVFYANEAENYRVMCLRAGGKIDDE